MPRINVETSENLLGSALTFQQQYDKEVKARRKNERKHKHHHVKEASAMGNKYLEKVARKDHATYGDALKTQVKSKVRGAVEGTIGSIGGAALGAGAGLLALKTRTGAKLATKVLRDSGLKGEMKEVLKQKGLHEVKPVHLVAAGLGGGAGYVTGGVAGAVHGNLASTRNSLQAQREKRAFTDLIGGYAGANKGDKVGGTLLGGGVLGGGTMITLNSLGHHPLVTLAGGAAGGYLGGKLYSKVKQELEGKDYHKHEKKASIGSDALSMAKNFGRRTVTGATKLPDQLGNLSKAVQKRGLFSSATAGAMKPILKNNAVRVGAGLVGTGVVAGATLSSGQQKQSSVANKYLEKIAADWIQKATPPSSKGNLHKALGVPEGKKIPAAKLDEAAKKKGKVGKEARLAETLKKFKK